MNIASLAILGPGLLGGSLAIDLSLASFPDLRIWARRPEVLDQARARGIGGLLTNSLAEAVDGADLVVLATPVGAMPALAAQLAVLANPPRIVTDMGSVKGMVELHVAPLLRNAGMAFVGAHPMCGSEQKGLSAARAGLFTNAMCLLTPQPQEDPEVLATVRAFWLSLGCRVAELTPTSHDEAVARVSHLPHAAAALLAATAVGGKPDLLAYSAGGFRDSTRVADGPPDMWTEILLENRKALSPLLHMMARQLTELAEALDVEDATKIHALLEAGRAARSPLPVVSSSAMV